MNLQKKRYKFEEYKRKKNAMLRNKSDIPLKIRKMIRPILRGILKVNRKMQGYRIEVMGNTEISEDKPIIFAVSHIGKLDYEIISEVIKRQYYVLAADFLNTKGTFSGFFMWMSGVIYMDVRDKEDRKKSRSIMMKVLEQKGNIMIFPEGTWNLSPNELIYDIQLGAVDMALASGAVIIPISLEQYEEQKKFVVNVGKAMALNHTEKGSITEEKIEKTLELRDMMATLKYEIWEHEGITERTNIGINYWPEFVQRRYAEWPGYDFKEQIINCYIPKAKSEYWSLMHDIRRIKIRAENRFLFMRKDEFLKEYS